MHLITKKNSPTHFVVPRNSSLASYFASKILAFKTPLPLGVSNDLPWGGYGFFLELHITFFIIPFPISSCLDVLGKFKAGDYNKENW